MSSTTATHWAALGESTFVGGIRLLAWVHRCFGRLPFRLLLLPVLGWMLLARPSARRASRQYLERLQATHGALGHAPRTRDVLRHFAAFGETLLDKLLATSGRYPFERVQVDGALPAAKPEGGGGVIVTAHIGCLELCQALAERQADLELAVLVHTRHAERFNALLRRLHPQRRIELLQVTELDPATAERLGALVARGGWVAIVGDRVPVRASKTVERPFLGHPARWPVGAYVLAALWRCPLVFMACVRQGGHHRLLLRCLSPRVELPRRDRAVALDALVARYVDLIEGLLVNAPLEWFNFFDFWAQPTEQGSRRT